MIGGLIMSHGMTTIDLPPKLAPVQVAIVPIWKSDEEKASVSAVSHQLKADLDKAGLRSNWTCAIP